MPRGRPARGVPCENCIRNASSRGQRSDEIGLCDECIAKLHNNTPSVQARPTQNQPDPNHLLENQSRQFIEAINTRNFDHPVWNLLAPDVQGCYLDTYAPTHGREAHMNVLRAIALHETPSYHIDITSTTTTSAVNEHDGTVDVQFAVLISGRPSGVQRQAHSLVRWRRQRNAQEGWRCVCRINA